MPNQKNLGLGRCLGNCSGFWLSERDAACERLMMILLRFYEYGDNDKEYGDDDEEEEWD